MIEVWKPILGYEGYYSVSNLGNVRAEERKVWKSDPNMKAGGCWVVRKFRLLPVYPKTAFNGRKEGYLEIRLCKDGKVKCLSHHRSVWSSFNGPIPEGYHIDHINNNPSDNRLENLQCLNPKDHRKITLERSWGVPMVQRYLDKYQEGDIYGIVMQLSKAFHAGYQQALKDLGER